VRNLPFTARHDGIPWAHDNLQKKWRGLDELSAQEQAH